METLAFINQKGGVAKTTSSLNVAACLAKRGFKTLVVDMDGQRNLTSTFNIDNDGGDVYEFLMKDKEPTFKVLNDKLYLMPGSREMSKFDGDLLRSAPEEASIRLSNKMDEYELDSAFDFVVFDCPPKMDLITINVMCYVEWVFIPTMADKYSIDGVEETYKNFVRLRKVNPKLKIGGIFFVRYDQRPILYRQFKASLEAAYPELMMKGYTRENVALRESIATANHIFGYSTESNGAQDYEKITSEMLSITKTQTISINQ
jgi:chromosome partitioning protein